MRNRRRRELVSHYLSLQMDLITLIRSDLSVSLRNLCMDSPVEYWWPLLTLSGWRATVDEWGWPITKVSANQWTAWFGLRESGQWDRIKTIKSIKEWMNIITKAKRLTVVEKWRMAWRCHYILTKWRQCNTQILNIVSGLPPLFIWSSASLLLLLALNCCCCWEWKVNANSICGGFNNSCGHNSWS